MDGPARHGRSFHPRCFVHTPSEIRTGPSLQPRAHALEGESDTRENQRTNEQTKPGDIKYVSDAYVSFLIEDEHTELNVVHILETVTTGTAI